MEDTTTDLTDAEYEAVSGGITADRAREVWPEATLAHAALAGRDASLGVGHVWMNMACPAYLTFNPADCICQRPTESTTALPPIGAKGTCRHCGRTITLFNHVGDDVWEHDDADGVFCHPDRDDTADPSSDPDWVDVVWEG